MAYFVKKDIYSGVAASGITSGDINVEGFDTLTLQIVGSPSTTTIRGSNDDGRSAAVTNWSTISTVIGGGLVYVTPGFAWLQAQRSETTLVTLSGWRDMR